MEHLIRLIFGFASLLLVPVPYGQTSNMKCFNRERW